MKMVYCKNCTYRDPEDKKCSCGALERAGCIFPVADDYYCACGEEEDSFITECRNIAIKENLPLYFVYYEETGVFEVYVTKTEELFEKRHCSKHLSDYEFKDLARQYLDDYSEMIHRQLGG